MTDPILLPGGRDVRATLDGAADSDRSGETADACVVACPPHPQHRGHRGDERLVAVGDHLTAAGVDCLRFDYGDWDEGYGELADAYAALDWASGRYDAVGLFGFSFGGCVALLAAGGASPTDGGDLRDPPELAAVSALAPAAKLAGGLDATATMSRIRAPSQVVYGARDDLANWKPVVETARELGWSVEELPADHFFVGQSAKVAAAVGGFLAARVSDGGA